MEGCTETMRFESLSQHVENECSFILKKCVYGEFGCDFYGTGKSRTEHLENCIYYKLRAFIDSTNQRIANLEKIVMEQQNVIATLNCDSEKEISEETKLNSKLIRVDEQATVVESVAQNILATKDLSCVKTLTSPGTGVTSVHEHNGSIYCGTYDGSLKKYDYYTGAIQFSEKLHQLSIWGLAVDEVMNRLYTGGSDGKLNVWDLENDQCINTIDFGAGKIYCILPKSNRIFAASSDHSIYILDKLSLNTVGALKGHVGGINSITIQGNYLISGSSDKSIKV
jgi:WD40 repeat protein